MFSCETFYLKEFFPLHKRTVSRLTSVLAFVRPSFLTVVTCHTEAWCIDMKLKYETLCGTAPVFLGGLLHVSRSAIFARFHPFSGFFLQAHWYVTYVRLCGNDLPQNGAINYQYIFDCGVRCRQSDECSLCKVKFVVSGSNRVLLLRAHRVSVLL